MKFGVSISNVGPAAQTENVLTIARLAQELEYDSIWVGDHLFTPYEVKPNYPYSTTGRYRVNPSDNVLEPLITMAFMAGVVEAPMVGVSVLIIPYRNPVVTAKMLATLDVLSGGRVILGAGIGWMPEEFEALGASYEDRASVTDEYIEMFKEFCTTEKSSFQGKHYQVSDIGFYPKPVQKPHPPVWIGGYSRAAIRRAVRLGDAWHPSNIAPQTIMEKLPTLKRLCQELGRDPDSIEITTRTNNVGFGDVGNESDGRIAPLSGTPQQMIDAIHQYEEAGVSQIVMGLRDSTKDGMVETVKRFAEDVRARL